MVKRHELALRLKALEFSANACWEALNRLTGCASGLLHLSREGHFVDFEGIDCTAERPPLQKDKGSEERVPLGGTCRRVVNILTVSPLPYGIFGGNW